MSLTKTRERFTLTEDNFRQLLKWANSGKLEIHVVPLPGEVVPAWIKDRPKAVARELVRMAWRGFKLRKKAKKDPFRTRHSYQKPERDGLLSPVEVRAHRLWSAARHRAKQRGLEFSITKEWVIERLVRGRCEVTGLPFRQRGSIKGVGRDSFAPSIDRRDPRTGYTLENCRVVVWIYNCAKGDASDEEVLILAAALVNAEAQAAKAKTAATQAPLRKRSAA